MRRTCVVPAGLTLLVMAVTLVGVGAGRTFKAAFLYSGTISDYGWTFTHNRGRISAHEAMLRILEPNDTIETNIYENVAADDVADLMQHLVNDYQTNILFGTSFVFHDQMFAAAKKFPQADFVHATGFHTGLSNFATVHGRVYQARYISGVVAGGTTKTRKIGYVASLPVPEVYRSINAYYVGAQVGAGAVVNATYVEHRVDVVVRWIGTFYDFDRERESTRELRAMGCDVVAYHTDSNAPPVYAKENGFYSVGSNANMRESVGESVLTSANFNWGPLYFEMMRRSYEGGFRLNTTDRSLWYGYRNGVATNHPPSFQVPPDTVAVYDSEVARMRAGACPFCYAVRRNGILQNTDPRGCIGRREMEQDMTYTVDGVSDTGMMRYHGEVCGNGTSFYVSISHGPYAYTVTCRNCSLGEYFQLTTTPWTRPATCRLCPPGTYADAPGSTTCAPCPEGMFQNARGAWKCEACPAGSTNLGIGNVDCPTGVDSGWSSTVIAVSVLAGVALLAIPVMAGKMSCDREEIQTMHSEADVARECASAIASMRLEDAEYIKTIEDPSEIIVSFIIIIDTLREYRKYLPAQLLDTVHPTTDLDAELQVTPPGLDGAPMTVLFTDIQGSTALWEAAPVAMACTLELHNRLTRELMAVFNGYEVKTIGDSFMVAFASFTRAVEFGVAIQTRLFEEPGWTHKILQCDGCRPKGHVWRGLRVRVGLYEGTPLAETNLLTGRVDYHGPCVNKAARIEAAGAGGAICLETHAIARLRSRNPRLVESLAVAELGPLALPGIAHSTELCLAVPQAMAARLPECMEVVRNRALHRPPPRDVVQEDRHRHSSVGTNNGRGCDDPSGVSQARRSNESNSSGSPHSRFEPPPSHSNPLHRAGHAPAHIESDKAAAGGINGGRFSVSYGISSPDFTYTRLCTVAVTSVAIASMHSLDEVSTALSIVLQNAERASGAVLSVLNDRIAVGWSLSQQQVRHLEMSVRYARMTEADSSLTLTTVCSGWAQNGTVGTCRQRFMTVVTPLLPCCQRLQDIAMEIGVRSAVSALPGQLTVGADRRLKQRSRPIARMLCLTSAAMGTPVTVYQLQPHRASLHAAGEKMWVSDGAADSEWVWGPHYWASFDADDFVVMRANNAGGDPVVQSIADHLETRGEHFTFTLKARGYLFEDDAVALGACRPPTAASAAEVSPRSAWLGHAA